MGLVMVAVCTETSWVRGGKVGVGEASQTRFGHFHRAAHKTRGGAWGGREDGGAGHRNIFEEQKKE